MEEVAHFLKVNLEEFKENFTKTEYSYFCKSKLLWSEEEIIEIYNKIRMPELKGRYCIFKNLRRLSLKAHEKIIIPTGVKVQIIDENYVLDIRKYNPPGGIYSDIEISAWNNIPFFDSDYEREIYILIKNNTEKLIEIYEDEGFACGIFLQVGCAF